VEFSISPASGLPIYQQLMEQICASMARGRLRPDERLPSVRELSELLVVNPNTVARAYTELEREGVLYTRPGLGVFVQRAGPPLSKKLRRERLTKPVDQVLVEAIRVGFTAEEIVEFIAERMKQYQWTPVAAPAK